MNVEIFEADLCVSIVVELLYISVVKYQTKVLVSWTNRHEVELVQHLCKFSKIFFVYHFHNNSNRSIPLRRVMTIL